MTTQAQATSVRSEIVVEAPIERAFAVFTEQFDRIKPREHNMLARRHRRDGVRAARRRQHLRPRRRRQRVPVGARAGLRAARAPGVQLGHRPDLAGRDRPGPGERGRGALHRRDHPSGRASSSSTATSIATATAGRACATASRAEDGWPLYLQRYGDLFELRSRSRGRRGLPRRSSASARARQPPGQGRARRARVRAGGRAGAAARGCPTQTNPRRSCRSRHG